MRVDHVGPAFPVADISKTQCLGKTIFDWYAGQALASGMCPYNRHEFDNIAAWCSKMADAMIKVRGGE